MPNKKTKRKSKICNLCKSRRLRKSRKSRKLKGGAVLPIEYFGKNSGRYSTNNVNNKSAYGKVKAQSYGVINPDNTTGPKNLGPYPRASTQTGGRKTRYRKRRCRFHQRGRGFFDKVTGYFTDEKVPQEESEKKENMYNKFTNLFKEETKEEPKQEPKKGMFGMFEEQPKQEPKKGMFGMFEEETKEESEQKPDRYAWGSMVSNNGGKRNTKKKSKRKNRRKNKQKSKKSRRK